MTYRAGRDHRQYVVMPPAACTLGTPRGDYVVAFALPKAAKGPPSGVN